MNYYFIKTLKGDFDNTIEKVTEALKSEGFGVLTNIDLKTTLKNKLGVDLYNYKILGACNPSFAYNALLQEDKIGTMLPCNVIVQERETGKIEVAAVDPVASMLAIDNPGLKAVAIEVQRKLQNVINML